MLALLPMALTECLLQERNGGDAAEVHNATSEQVWVAHDLEDRKVVLLELEHDEAGPVCINGADEVYFYGVDPDVNPSPTPLAVVDFGGEDFCDGTYRWDGSTLSQLE